MFLLCSKNFNGGWVCVCVCAGWLVAPLALVAGRLVGWCRMCVYSSHLEQTEVHYTCMNPSESCHLRLSMYLHDVLRPCARVCVCGNGGYATKDYWLLCVCVCACKTDKMSLYLSNFPTMFSTTLSLGSYSFFFFSVLTLAMMLFAAAAAVASFSNQVLRKQITDRANT